MNAIKHIALLAFVSTLFCIGCSKQEPASSYPSFLQVGKQYVIGIAKKTPRNESTPIDIFEIKVIEHGGGSWYRISFTNYQVGVREAKTLEAWFNLNEATFVSEKSWQAATELFPVF